MIQRQQRSRCDRTLLTLAIFLVSIAGVDCGRSSTAAVPKTTHIDVGTFGMQLGDSTTLHLQRPAGVSDTEPVIQWSSSDTSILIIDSSSVARAVGTGRVTITALTSDSTYVKTVSIRSATLVGAGDIASCGSNGAAMTAALLDSIPGHVFTAGDNAYENGTADEWLHCYQPTWGRHKSRTRPSMGNHDSYTNIGQPYYDYWGAAAGPTGLGYYSYNIGPWHVIVLNVMLPHSGTSPQELWLRADLAAHPALCTVAYWHYPRFSSAHEQHSDPGMQAVWEDLYAAGADIVISGHSHTYERFAPQTPDGLPDPARGIREFVVGTGGASLLAFDTIANNSEVRDNSSFGVLKLTLSRGNYSWEFVPVKGGNFTDSGSGTCHH